MRTGRYQAVVDQDEIHRMAWSEDVEERREAANEIRNSAILSDNEQAWDDLHRLIYDEDESVRLDAGYVLCSIFLHIPDRKQAWDDLIWLTASNIDMNIGWYTSDVLGSAFPYVPDKKQAQDNLHCLTHDQSEYGDLVRLAAVYALGSNFPYVPDKEQAWNDLVLLTYDNNREVRAFANYSLGRVSILKATELQSEEDFRKELELAIKFFEKAAKEQTFDFLKPPKFCLPFYRSFYTIVFKKEDVETEVQKYLSEAKGAIEGSKSKGRLLEAVENLSNALTEAQKVWDFDSVKSDLNAYRRYCDRACELLDTTEEKAPGASRLIRKGLPIIDERIKGIIAEIQEKAGTICKQTKGTAFEGLGKDVYNAGQNLSKVRDPIGLEKRVQNMQIALSAICAKIPEEERGVACELLKRANDEPYIEDKIELINMFLSKIPSQIENGESKLKIEINNSTIGQIGIGHVIINPKKESDLGSNPKNQKFWAK